MAKSLKDQNRWQIWLIVTANALLLYGVSQANAISITGLSDAFAPHNLLPVGMALTISIVLNGLLSADNKAKLVFLRWQNTLPSHQAFSKYAKLDPRIDLDALEKLHGSKLPKDPVEENKTWFRMYKSVENSTTVFQVHRDFLLLRDYTGLSFLFLVFLGSIGIYVIESLEASRIYLGILIIQYLTVRQAASNYGIRMVTTVLSEKIHQ